MNIGTLVNVAKLGIRNHKAGILIFGGIAVGVGAAVTACVKSTKLHEIVEDKNKAIDERKTAYENGEFFTNENNELQQYTEKEYKQDKRNIQLRYFLKLMKLYAIPAGLGALAIIMILKGNGIKNTTIADLVLTNNALVASNAEIRKRMAEEVGDKKAAEIFANLHKVGETTEVKDSNGDILKEKNPIYETNNNDRWTIRYNRNTSKIWSPYHDSNVKLFTDMDRELTDNRLDKNGAVLMTDVAKFLYIIDPKDTFLFDGWIRKDLGGKDGFIMTKATCLNYDEQDWLLEFNCDGDIRNQYSKAVFAANRPTIRRGRVA